MSRNSTLSTDIKMYLWSISIIYKSIFTTGKLHWSTALSVKSISGVALSGNARGSIKYHYFDAISGYTFMKSAKSDQFCDFLGKIAFKLITTNFLRERYMPKKKQEDKTKTKSMKLKLYKTLNMRQFWASWTSNFIFRGLSKPVCPLISFSGTYH